MSPDEENDPWDDERTEKEMKKLLAADPYAALLAPISTDRKIAVTKTLQQPAWTANVYGDSTEYNSESNADSVSYGVAVARSL